jgi:hypothetical protein
MDIDNGERITAGIKPRPVGQRFCYYTDESHSTRNDDGTVAYRVVFVTEDKAGYADNFPVTFPTLELAQERVDLLNKGLTVDEVADIRQTNAMRTAYRPGLAYRMGW